MNNDMDANLDLLDLEDDSTLDALPDAAPFAAPRPKKPWLLLGVGVLVIILATYVIIRTIGSDSRSSIEIDLDAPEIVTVDGAAVAPAAPENPTPAPVPAPVAAPVEVVAPAPVQPAPAPAAQPSNATPGVPVRVVADRADVTFKPDQVAPAPKPAAKPAAKPATPPRKGRPQTGRQTPPRKSRPRPQNPPRKSPRPNPRLPVAAGTCSSVRTAPVNWRKRPNVRFAPVIRICLPANNLSSWPRYCRTGPQHTDCASRLRIPPRRVDFAAMRNRTAWIAMSRNNF